MTIRESTDLSVCLSTLEKRKTRKPFNKFCLSGGAKELVVRWLGIVTQGCASYVTEVTSGSIPNRTITGQNFCNTLLKVLLTILYAAPKPKSCFIFPRLHIQGTPVVYAMLRNKCMKALKIGAFHSVLCE